MRRWLFIVAALLALLPVPSFAADGPEAFLSALLTTNFEGDCIPLHGHVLYSDGRSFFPIDCDCGPEPRENFFPNNDLLIVVTSWRITDVHMETRTKALITARYHVIATAEREGDQRKIVPSSTSHEEDVTYKVWLRKGRWFWVDPPELPRVGYYAVRDAVAKEVSDRRGILAKHTGPEQDFHRRALAHYEAELAALDALRPMVPEE